MGLFHCNPFYAATSALLTGPFPKERLCLGFFLSLPCLVEIHGLNANSADTDQMPHSVESDQGLHCFFYETLCINDLRI